MALIVPGSLAGQISGRIGSVVYSHNRGGPYVRNGTIPTTVTSEAAINAKGRLAAQSQAWDDLTAAQRISWGQYALSNPVTNRVGHQVTLSGNAAFVGINTRLALAGVATLSVPPIADPPTALTSITPAYDIGAGDFDVVFAATPLAADEYLWIQATVLNNIAVTYYENLLRHLAVSAAAQASPFDTQVAMEARFGTLIVGQKVVYRISVFSDTTGLLSAPVQTEGIIVTT